MYFFHCEETRPLVSIFTYIDAMLLNLEAQVPQQMKRKFVNLSVLKVLKNFIKFQIFQKISKKKKKKKKKKNQFQNFKIFQKFQKFQFS